LTHVIRIETMAKRLVFALAFSLCFLSPQVSQALDDGATEGSLTVTLSSAPYNIILVGEGQRIEMEGFGYLMNPGKPMLPQKKFLIALPPGARAKSVEVEGALATELSGTYRIAPTSPMLPVADAEMSSEALKKMNQEWQGNYRAVYRSDVGYPGETVGLAGAGSLRKYAYASVSFCPFRYHPQSGRLVHYDDARVTVHYVLPSPDSPESRRIEELKWDALADRKASILLINFGEVSRLYQPLGSGLLGTTQAYNYVIITTGALSNAVTSSDFVTWKTSLGYDVRIVLTTDPEISGQDGTDLAARIRNFLRNYYGSWGIEYVLLVGDYATVPMRDYYYADLSLPDSSSWDLDGDLHYGEYGQDLPDLAAEVSVGRIPTSNTTWITYALNKLVAFEQDDGAWKDQALHGGAILFHENQNHDPTLPKIDGTRVLAQIEMDLMGGWTVSHYTEKEGLEPSDYPWPALTGAVFTSTWRDGQYGVVNWSGHGAPSGAYRLIWNWDDGDGVFETDGSDGYTWDPFIANSMNLEDDCPSIIFAVSCSVGRPESTGYGNFGIDLIANPSLGASAGVVSATRPASITRDWPSEPGATESICYEFNRFLINGPEGPEKVGDALYDAKHYCNLNYSRDHYREYLDLYNFNLYGEPAMDRRGSQSHVVAQPSGGLRQAITLEHSTPNPFNGNALIRFGLPEPGHIVLSVQDVRGRRVAVLADGYHEAGEFVKKWDGRDNSSGEISPGIYFISLEAGDQVATQKVVFVR
jgi:hypothetical protein